MSACNSRQHFFRRGAGLLRPFAPFVPGLLVALALLWTAFSTLSVYPHQLAYFNEAAGGPENGHRHLLHSNLDWGQDLLIVKKWLEKQTPQHSLYLAYHGFFNPIHIDFNRFQVPPAMPFELSNDSYVKSLPKGTYALSVNYLYGDQRLVPHPEGFLQRVDPCVFTAFAECDHTSGPCYSIRVFQQP